MPGSPLRPKFSMYVFLQGSNQCKGIEIFHVIVHTAFPMSSLNISHSDTEPLSEELMFTLFYSMVSLLNCDNIE